MSENTTSKATSEPKVRQPVLRKVDLNLLTIFDTVMQEQSLTKAAHTLGMSQPAVSSRSEERRVGKECLRLCRSRWSPYH